MSIAKGKESDYEDDWDFGTTDVLLLSKDDSSRTIHVPFVHSKDKEDSFSSVGVGKDSIDDGYDISFFLFL